MSIFNIFVSRKLQPADESLNSPTLILILLQQPKTAPKYRVLSLFGSCLPCLRQITIYSPSLLNFSHVSFVWNPMLHRCFDIFSRFSCEEAVSVKSCICSILSRVSLPPRTPRSRIGVPSQSSLKSFTLI